MRHIPTMLLLLAPLHAAAALPEFDANYMLERGRITIGETRMRLERSQDGIYRYTSESRATGLLGLFVDDVIREESIFRYEDDAFWPVSYEYRHEGSDKNRDEEIVYDWTERVARIDYRGHDSRVALEAGTLDRFLLQLGVTTDIRSGATEVTYRVLDNNRVKQYRLHRDDEETIKTPAGTFNTVRVQRIDDREDKQLSLWLAPELDYLPVKIEQTRRNEETMRLVLKGVREEKSNGQD